MKYRGPLGLPRITRFGPLTVESTEYEQLPSEAIEGIADVVVKNNNLPSDGMSEDQVNTFITESVSRIYNEKKYPQEVRRAKMERMITCMKKKWADEWVDGLKEAGSYRNDQKELETDRGRLTMMLKGCYGMTESQTSDEPTLIPRRFKNLPVPVE